METEDSRHPRRPQAGSAGRSSKSSTRARPPSASSLRASSPTRVAPCAVTTTTTDTSTTMAAMLYAQPATVHFAGFALDQTYEQRVRVHNNSAKPVRMQFTFPQSNNNNSSTSSSFRARLVAPPASGFVPPGLHQELAISFTPTALQYHHDTVRVRAEQVAYASNTTATQLGACAIALHAYPALADEALAVPSRLDFGVVPLGTTAHRHLELGAKATERERAAVPIVFEFALAMVHAHPDFVVFPWRGVIPAGGVARIEIEFTPRRWATSRAELELRVSQLGMAPRRCELLGSSAPPGPQQQQQQQQKKQQAMATTQAPASSPARGPGSANAASPSSGKKPARTMASSYATYDRGRADNDTGSRELLVDADTMAGVNRLLMQQPGKLSPRELHRTIVANRMAAATDENDGGAIGNNTTTSSSTTDLLFAELLADEAKALETAQVPRHLRELTLLRELSALDQNERALEIQSHRARLGQPLLTPAQVDVLREMRALNAATQARREREARRRDVTTHAFSIHARAAPTTRSVSPVKGDSSSGSYGTGSTVVGSATHKATTLAAATETAAAAAARTRSLLPPPPALGVLPAHFCPLVTPDFKSYKNDLWRKRQRVVQRFVRAVSTVVVRVRAQRHLELLQRHLRHSAAALTKTRAKTSAKTNKSSARASAKARAKAKARPRDSLAESPTRPAPERRLQMESFPLVAPESRPPRADFELPRAWPLKFDPFTFFPLRERNEAQLMGHEPLPLPALPTYVPLETARVQALRRGAWDECGVHGALTGSSTQQPPVAPRLETRTASVLEMLPRDVFLRRSAAFRPRVRLQRMRETMHEYVLRPQRVFRTPPRRWRDELEPAMGTRSLLSLRTAAHLLGGDEDGGRVAEEWERLLPTERRRALPLLHWVDDEEAVPVASHDETKELYGGVWQAARCAVPELLRNAEQVPCLSDSESEGEEQGDDDAGGRREALPVWRDALQLWEERGPALTARSSHEDGDASASKEAEDKDGVEDGDAEEDDGVAYEADELLGRRHGVSCFPRYRRSIQRERAYNQRREAMLQQLPTMLDAVAARIDHPDYALVVRGHGPTRPLHAPYQLNT